MGSLPHVVEDCLGIVQVYSDGSISRSENIKFNFPNHDDGKVLWKDIKFNYYHNLHLRLYKPHHHHRRRRLPILYFIHGGGFCVGSRAWPNIHNTCLRLSSALNALVISPDYRLAPEHRLPAAQEDINHALHWLQAQAQASSTPHDTWLSRDGVDFDRVYIIGDSSGGNIAHHLAVELGVGSPGLAPVRVRGYVLVAPFFGGTKRTKSEAEGPPEPFLNLDILDRFWRLSIPIGDTADHPLANPFGPRSPNLETVKLGPMLVIVGECEVLKDRVQNYAMEMKELGKTIQYVEFEGKQHGFFTNDPYSDVSEQVLKEIENFISENSN